MTIFEFADYKLYLKAFIKKLERRGVLTDLARAAGCTHSYLSQVLNGKPELTPDQALSATDYLQLSGEESRYFLTLVLKSRAVTPKLKKHYDEQLKTMKSAQLQVKTAVKSTTDTEVSHVDRDIYYASWIMPLVHTLTSCKDFQTTTSIASRTRLSTKEVQATLDWLLQKKLIEKKDNKYIHSGKNLHLPTNSIHNRVQHLSLRLKAQDTSNDPSAIHYASTFAVSLKDIDILRSHLIDFVEKQRLQISKSGSEDVMIFCCDLFQP